MSITTRFAARRVLAGALATAALTTGVGLAGSGVAEANTPPQACIVHLSGSTTINDHGRISTLGVGETYQLCIDNNFADGATQPVQSIIGVASVKDPQHPGFNTESLPKLGIGPYDAYDGIVDVQLTNEVHNGPNTVSGNPTTKALTVYAKKLKTGNGYSLRNVTIDGAGRVADTTVNVNLSAPLVR